MRLHLPLFAIALLVSQGVLAHGKEQHTASTVKPGRDSSAAQLSVDPAAAEAVAAVERFSTALGTGDLTAAGAELDPAVLILESGGAERSRDEYLAGHARNDAEFLKNAHMSLKRRTAHAAGDLAWVGSESEIHAMKGAEMLMISSTETMVVRNTARGWKIVHIHWSSRKAAPPKAAAIVPPAQPRATSSASTQVPGWLPETDVRQLTTGAGAGMARAAEAHGLPGPKHVLELADRLGLTAAQRATMQALQAEMSTEALERGRDVLAAEAALDRELASPAPDAERVRTLASAAGEARGRLRHVHLGTHLRASPVLTPAQRSRYRELRRDHG